MNPSEQVNSGVSREYWPTNQWLNDTPESRGMDSQELNYMFEVIETKPNETIYYASGSYEQKIYICPDEDLFVLFTGEIKVSDRLTESLLLNHILPAKSISDESPVNDNESEPESPQVNGNNYFLIILVLISSIVLVFLASLTASYLVYKKH